MWGDTGNKFAIYMANVTSFNNATVCRGVGFDSHATRFRMGADTNVFGWIFENSNEICRATDGYTYIKGDCSALTYISTSDYRIKENVTTLTDESTSSLRPVKYFNKINKQNEYGFIAHEVQEAYPEMVTGIKDDPEKNQQMNYNMIISLLVNDIKKLKKEVEELKINL